MTTAVEHTLHITEEERTTLMNALAEDLKELSIESRRADKIDCREVLHHEEAILQGLMEKLRTMS